MPSDERHRGLNVLKERLGLAHHGVLHKELDSIERDGWLGEIDHVSGSGPRHGNARDVSTFDELRHDLRPVIIGDAQFRRSDPSDAWIYADLHTLVQIREDFVDDDVHVVMGHGTTPSIESR